MNNQKKALIALLGILVLVFSFVTYRLWLGKPTSTIKLTSLAANEQDPTVWGKYYPLEYASYQKNQQMTASPTGYGGSEKVQKSDMQPELLTNFNGSPFGKDYSEDRGHVYAMEDLRETKRIGPTSKGACITCKTPYLSNLYQELGWGYANQPLADVMGKTNYAINCANCHDPSTMKLRVINPAFIEAMQRKNIDVNAAGRNDMRSYVCAQCHSEYYFEPGSNKVVFPWDQGLTAAATYEYYQTKPGGFVQDFQQADSKTAILKAQHPDYEEWANGTHGKAGVSCADCHMPYICENGVKYSSHWMTSPLQNLDDSCTTCHDQGKDWLLERVKNTQDNVWQLQHTAGGTIAQAHLAIKQAMDKQNVNQQELDKARELVRKAQWYWDYVAAANSMGFHNSVQDLNTLGQAIDFANQSINTANKAAVGQ